MSADRWMKYQMEELSDGRNIRSSLKDGTCGCCLTTWGRPSQAERSWEENDDGLNDGNDGDDHESEMSLHKQLIKHRIS